MTQTFPAADGTQIAYTDQGTGVPLLCLAGLTRSMADFDYLRPHLPPIRMIAMDYRGRGASGHSRAESYTVLQEARDVVDLMDYLGLQKVAVLGTSRGGLIGMVLAAIARDRLLGLCLNDVGPVIETAGLARIAGYLGRNPVAKTHAELAHQMPGFNPGFVNVPPARWLAEAQKHYIQTAGGLQITYDPALRTAFLAALTGPQVDMWPLFAALDGLPLALIRGANSDLLSQATADVMRARRPDMIFANIPDRAHIPFLDEPESVEVIHQFLKALP